MSRHTLNGGRVRFVPVGNTVLVQLEHDAGVNGIVLPDGSDTKRERARVKVVKVGQGRLLADGTFSPVPCIEGDYVSLVKTPRCQSVMVAGEEYLVVDADSILGVYRE